MDDETLLDALRELAEELGKTPTRTEMNDHGPYSSTPYYTRWGSWNAALEAAGLGVNHRNDVSDEELIEDLQEDIQELDSRADQIEQEAQQMQQQQMQQQMQQLQQQQGQDE